LRQCPHADTGTTAASGAVIDEQELRRQHHHHGSGTHDPLNPTPPDGKRSAAIMLYAYQIP
jgi:hypothetical protein